MNGLCSGCGQPVEVVDFRLDAGLLVVRCPACGREQRLSVSEAGGAGPVAAAPSPAPGSATPGNPQPAARPMAASTSTPSPERAIASAFEPPPGFCPKCIAPRAPEARACPACGLLFANYQPSELQPSAPVAAGWKALAANWESAAGHLQFLRLATASNELPAAGRLYRIRLAQTPDDALARGGVQATVKAASVAVSVHTIRRETTIDFSQKSKRKLLVVALVLLGPMVISFVLLRFLGGH